MTVIKFAPTTLRWIFFAFSFLAIGALGICWAAFLEQGASPSIIIYSLSFFLFFLLIAFATWLSFQEVRLNRDEMVWIRPGLAAIAIPYADITKIEKRQVLNLHTKHTVYWLNSPMRRVLSQLQNELIDRATAPDATQPSHFAGFPINYQQPAGTRYGGSIALTLLGGILLAISIGWVLFGLETGDGILNLFFQVFMAFLMGTVGLVLLYLPLFHYVWVYHFTEREIIVQNILRQRRYAVKNISDISLKKTTRTTRGLSRTAWFLQIDFSDGKVVNVEGSENGGFSGYDPLGDERELRELIYVLKRAYLKEEEKQEGRDERAESEEVETHEKVRDGVMYHLDAALYGLEIEAIYREERSPGADVIEFVFDRPVIGLDEIKTINGKAALSPNQRYLAFWEPDWLFVIDLGPEDQYWLREREMWRFEDVRFDEQHLHVTLALKAQPKETLDLTPIPLEDMQEVLIPQARLADELQLPQDKLSALLNTTLLLPESAFYDEFETLRDLIREIGPKVVPDLLAAARQPRYRSILELLATVLADYTYPPAAASFVNWLDHENDEIVHVAARALDQLSGNLFGIDKMIEGGWVQYDQIRATRPKIRAWWDLKGGDLPTHAAWLAYQESQRPLTEREKWFNFVELNPEWVRQGDGVVQHPIEDYQMPRNVGIHTLGGTVQLPDESAPRFAAVEVDSFNQQILSVNVKVDGVWVDVTTVGQGLLLKHRFNRQ